MNIPDQNLNKNKKYQQTHYCRQLSPQNKSITLRKKNAMRKKSSSLVTYNVDFPPIKTKIITLLILAFAIK